MLLLDTYIPWDKSWFIRMGVLDLLYRQKHERLAILEFFNTHNATLSEDLQALRMTVQLWREDMPVDVGESGTLYRFLQFASWKQGLGKIFILRGTLKERPINNDPTIVNLSQTELLKLDNHTSQWASAAVLAGDNERLLRPPYKLALTYQADNHWWRCQTIRRPWELRRDGAIRRQAVAFDSLFYRKQTVFKPEQAEDFCFARALGFMTSKQGATKWPSLRGHESDRVVEIETALSQAKEGKAVRSRGHRVVQATAMWCVLNKKPPLFESPQAVNKSWPQFWSFLQQYS